MLSGVRSHGNEPRRTGCCTISTATRAHAIGPCSSRCAETVRRIGRTGWRNSSGIPPQVGSLGLCWVQSKSGRSIRTPKPVVHREVPYEGYRADLVIEWADGSYTHIEVKVGDQALAKTLATAEAVANRFGRDHRSGSDAVLFLPSQREAWDRACDALPEMRDRVHPLTWRAVARALRRALPQSAGESIHWRVWAHAFSGAVEQDLLYMRSGRDPHAWARSLPFTALNTASVLLTPDGDDS